MPKKKQSTASLVKRLSALSRQFGPEYVDEKHSILKLLARAKIKNPDQLLLYHDTLCFMRAYPDNKSIEVATEQGLMRFDARIKSLKRSSNKSAISALADSGIVGTETSHPFGYEISQLLKSLYGARVKIDWDRSAEDWEDKLIDFLPLLVAWQENDAIDNDDYFDTEEFLRRARGSRSRDDLASLLQLVEGSGLPKAIKRFFFESLDLDITWDLTSSPASRTLCRMPSSRRFRFDLPLRPRCRDLRAELKKPTGKLVRLSAKEGQETIKTACEVLSVRNRELYPITLANPEEIYRIGPGRGLQIYLFATPPEVRLPLETNFGAMFARNGVPIGYGIAASLFERVEIAMNVFPAFRAGESSYIIEEFFKVFYHHFGSRVFLVRSMQMGNDEEEALHSGAFWFYYKLGFRAIDPAVRKLAEKEYVRQKKQKGYRTPLRTMKRLAVSDVLLKVDEMTKVKWKEPSLANLGYKVTDYFSKQHDGDRVVGQAVALEKVRRALGIRNLGTWSTSERQALTRLAPLLVSIPGLGRWNLRERRDLVEIIRAKGGKYERDFALLTLKHTKFRNAVEDLSR